MRERYDPLLILVRRDDIALRDGGMNAGPIGGRAGKSVEWHTEEDGTADCLEGCVRHSSRNLERI
jgi:hypothetical protein